MRKLLLIVFVLFFTGISYPQMAVVIGDNAYLRGSPVETGAVVDTLLPGSNVAIIRQQGPWFLVQASPFVGWMHGNSLRLKRTAKPAPAPIASPAETASTLGGQSLASADTKPKAETPAQATPSGTPATPTQPSASEKRKYIRGPRGGCYYVRPDGKKVYGDHNLCNESP